MNKPADFDGVKFATKYGLDPMKDFYDDGNGNLICISLPNLTDADLLDCVSTILVTISPSQQIILADGVDAAIITLQGAPGTSVEYTINDVPQATLLNSVGADTIELTCDTPNTTIVVQAGDARAVIYAVEVPS